MTFQSMLVNISTISQGIVRFLFASKYSMWFIILIVILILLWNGLGSKTEEKPTEQNPEVKKE